MYEFKIGDTDFGIEASKSYVSISEIDGVETANIEVFGDPDKHAEISESINSRWNWTIYPPHFYLREYPVKKNLFTQTRKIEASSTRLENYDAAIYLVEHFFLDQLFVKLSKKGVIKISGKVQVLNEWQKFFIQWQNE